MDFFESLSKSKQIILNNIMTYQSEFFYQNKKYFKIILLRYENKPLPKRKLINYLPNGNKDNESLFLSDYDFKESNEMYDREGEKVIDYLSKKREREKYNDEFLLILFWKMSIKKLIQIMIIIIIYLEIKIIILLMKMVSVMKKMILKIIIFYLI